MYYDLYIITLSSIRKLKLKKKIALISGLLGKTAPIYQNFIRKNYEVHGIKRRSSSFNTGRLESIYVDPHENNNNFFFTMGI